MPKTSKPAADPTRVSTIAGQIQAAASPVTFSAQDNDQAKDAAKMASDNHRTTREGVFVILADLSHTGQWTDTEITEACIRARKITNAQDNKAVATFIGEAKSAMDPVVRGHVSALVILRDAVWNAEEEFKASDPEAGTLFKDVFKRKQHMLSSMFNATRDGRRLVTPNDMVAFAHDRAEEQRLATDKIVKKIKTLQTSLSEIYRDYQEEDLGAAISSLEKINVDTLNAVKRAAVLSDTTSVVDNEAEQTEAMNEVIEEDHEVHAGLAASDRGEPVVSTDPLQDALDDMDLHLAA